ncbi:hypothetical protein J6590_043254 [Homalodisca vitripennis]|nr:hypothetical protein J6590_043254 [Homalodisca vitripennis]
MAVCVGASTNLASKITQLISTFCASPGTSVVTCSLADIDTTVYTATWTLWHVTFGSATFGCSRDSSGFCCPALKEQRQRSVMGCQLGWGEALRRRFVIGGCEGKYKPQFWSWAGGTVETLYFLSGAYLDSHLGGGQTISYK